MSSLVILAAAAFAGAASLPPAATSGCDTGAMMHEADARAPGQARKLGELPPAAHYLTVFRTVDGCPRPVIVHYGIGANRPAR